MVSVAETACRWVRQVGVTKASESEPLVTRRKRTRRHQNRGGWTPAGKPLYGAPRGSNPIWANGKGFVGGDNDPTNLVNIGARQYDPALGRFISVDPIMDLADPKQWNAYAYAHNNPISFSDPTGLKDCDYADCNADGSNKNPGGIK